MNENMETFNNNIFDNDDNFYISNSSYSNGFGQFFNSKNFTNYYIKKRVKNNSIKNKNNSSHIEKLEIMSNKNCYFPTDLTQDSFRIETIPIFNLKLYQTKDISQSDNKKMYFNEKSVNNSLNSNKNQKLEKAISNTSIDEINISLKQLSVNGSREKKKNQKNSRNKIAKKQITYKSLKNLNFTQSKINSEKSCKLNNKSKIKNIIFKDNKKIFNKLIIKKENQFSYIINNENYKIIILKKIINKQNININILREQNKNLIEKIKRMHEENVSILEYINSLKSELSNYNKIGKKNNNNYIDSKNYILDKCLSEPNEKSNLKIIKENILSSKKIIYSLYDNNNLLTYNFNNNKYKLIQIKNEEFKNEFNKELNTLYYFNNVKNKIYIIAGMNNDQLYIYNIKSNKIKKYATLKNNHMFGSLIFISNKKNKEKEELICLSGKYNKKVEIYNDENDMWDDKIIEEMPEERCNSFYLVLNNNYIYGFYGYNYILKQYLNNIVYYDLNNNKWNKILDNLLDNNIKGIKNHFCYENKKDKFIYILGGDNNDNKIIIDLEKKSIVKINKDKENKKNKEILFHNYAYNIWGDHLALFDKYFNIHIIDFFSNEKELIHYANESL